MPANRDEEKIITGLVYKWAGVILQVGIASFMTYTCAQQNREKDLQESRRENQVKFNTDIERKVYQNSDRLDYISKDVEEVKKEVKEMQKENRIR